MRRAAPVHGLALVLSASAAAKAQAPANATSTSGPIVSTAWLADRLRDPNLVLLHVGEKADYEAGHIPARGGSRDSGDVHADQPCVRQIELHGRGRRAAARAAGRGGAGTGPSAAAEHR